MSKKHDRVDIIARNLRDLSRELDGFERAVGGGWVGQAYVTRENPWRSPYYASDGWHGLEFRVRDDYGKDWSFHLVVSPSGRVVHLVHGKGSQGRIREV